MLIHRKFWFHFFLGVTPFLNLEIWPKCKILLKQLVSTTPLKLVNRIAWNFVVMKDIMCRYAFIQEMLIWSFWGAIYIPFFVRLPIPNAWNCHLLYTAFSSNVGAWGMWACSLFLSFFVVISKFDIEWEMLIFLQLIFTSQQTYELMHCLEELTTEYKLGRKKDGLVDIAFSLTILQNWLFI